MRKRMSKKTNMETKQSLPLKKRETQQRKGKNSMKTAMKVIIALCISLNRDGS